MEGGFFVVPGDLMLLRFLFHLYGPVPKIYRIHGRFKMIERRLAPIVRMDLKHGDDQDRGLLDLREELCFRGDKRVGHGHMVVFRKFPRAASGLEVLFDLLFPMVDLLLIGLQHIILELLIDRLGTRTVGHIHRLFKKHAGNRRKNRHQKNDNDDGPLHKRFCQNPNTKPYHGSQHRAGRATGGGTRGGSRACCPGSAGAGGSCTVCGRLARCASCRSNPLAGIIGGTGCGGCRICSAIYGLFQTIGALFFLTQ